MKKRICVDVDSKVMQALEKRAKKELFSVKELAEDILRRSAISSKQAQSYSASGDRFIEYFSRTKYKKKKNKRKK